MKKIFIIALITLSNFVHSQNNNTPKKGFYTIPTIGIMPGQNLSNSFHIVNGYVVNNRWHFGIGIGVENIAKTGYVPGYLTTKFNLFPKLTSPYVSVMAGYNFPMYHFNAIKGGFTTGLKIGLDHFFNNHVGLTTSIGYRYAYLKTKNLWWDDFFTIREINRVELQFGIIIK